MKKTIRMAQLLLLTALGVGILSMNIDIVCAEEVQYTYDTLGRIKTAEYEDGTQITYIYDSNGNIKDVKKKKLAIDQETSSTEEKNEGKNEEKNEEESVQSAPTEEPQTSETERLDVTTEHSTEVQSEQNNNNQNSIVQISSKDIKAYNKFKKRKPVIKALSQKNKKNKRSLKIEIVKLKKTGNYPEHGYQIKYATNKKFRNAKTITINKKKKKSISSETWLVKRNKKYFVKVRAYMRTKTGKKIYTKYSKVKTKVVK